MNVKVMVVDDSPFSRMMIGEILSEGGYEVVGEANGLESLIEVFNNCTPDIVTMDIAMQGTDGFECSREILIRNPKAKIILVSSMKDEESVAHAKRIGISGYVQKPVDGETLIKIINNIMSPDSLFETLVTEGIEVFKESLSQNITRISKTAVHFVQTENCNALYLSQGITAIIGVIGQYSGSMIMDISFETAEKITAVMLRRPSKNREEVLMMVAELANVVAGIACSILNKKDKSFSLRVSPPSLFQGNKTEVVNPGVKMQTALMECDFGSVFLGLGFKKGLTLWM